MKKCGVKVNHGDSWTLVTVGRHSAEPPQDWYIVLFPNIEEEESLLRYHSTVRDRRLAAVRLLPKGWVTQVENQGNYKLGNLVDTPYELKPSLSESAHEHKKNFEIFANSLLENDKSSEGSEVFGSPEGIVHKDSDQPLDKDFICNSPHSRAKHGTELAITVNSIGGEGDMTPEKGRTERNKSPTKRPHSAPVEAGPHKKTKKPDPN